MSNVLSANRRTFHCLGVCKLLWAISLLVLSSCDSGSNASKGSQLATPPKTSHVEIDGVHYEIPHNYQWRSPIRNSENSRPSTYVNVNAASIEALLPDFDSYNANTKSAFDSTVGHGRLISILIRTRLDTIKPPRQIIAEQVPTGIYQQAPNDPEVTGLRHYVQVSPNATDGVRADIFLEEEGESRFWMTCTRHVDSPGCHVQFLPAEKSLPYLDFEFGREYLKEWKKIRQGVVRLVSSFTEKHS